MSATFTPLVPPALPAPPPGTAPLRTKVLRPPAPPPIFRPIHRTETTLCHAAAPEPTPTPAAPETAPSAVPTITPTPAQTLPTPTVSYTQENGQITRIRVQCPCGAVVELECVY